MNRRLAVLSILLVAGLIMIGCSGEDGAVGPEGPKGDPGSPQPVKVLFAGAPAISYSIEGIIIEFTRLELFPMGTEINYFNLSSLPRLSELNEYEVIFVFTDTTPYEPDSLGDVMADYVDGGGKLVMTQYCFSNTWGMGGEIMTTGYCPFEKGDAAGAGGNRQIDASSVSIPIHPIFNGADLNNLVFWANTSFTNPTLDSGATLIATDTGGVNTIAINEDGNIIALNMFPGRFDTEYYSSLKVMANACLFVADAY